jgi:superfamily II DNA or RNA helicase
MTRTVSATIDYKIRVRPDDLGPALDAVIEALEIPNMAKQEARKQDLWGWQNMPETISLAEWQDGLLVMPRGFAQDFVSGMDAYGARVEFDDRRTWRPKFRIGKNPKPDSWQEPAIEAMIGAEQGIYKAPAGSGKTVAILIVARRLACKSIVIVNTKDILWQWQERVNDFLGEHYPCGQIGDNIFDVSPYLTIATAQTLHSRFNDLASDGFFDEFSLACLDECHHATAETYNRVMDRFSARYRFGVSATPDKTGDFALATNVVGPIIHETRPEKVDRLIKPKVIRVPTKFGFGFRGHVSRWQRSNYPQMIDALIRNPERNEQIVNNVLANEGHHQLVISKRLEHLAILRDLLEAESFADPIVTITGKDINEMRQQAKALAETEPCVMLSTLADEAMDIPRLDRMHLTFPQRNAGLVTQQVGRVERKHPDKQDAIIYDYVDANVGPLEAQWRVRRTEVYMPRGYKIETQRAEVRA